MSQVTRWNNSRICSQSNISFLARIVDSLTKNYQYRQPSAALLAETSTAKVSKHAQALSDEQNELCVIFSSARLSTLSFQHNTLLRMRCTLSDLSEIAPLTAPQFTEWNFAAKTCSIFLQVKATTAEYNFLSAIK
jgi:hypothetical protein